MLELIASNSLFATLAVVCGIFALAGGGEVLVRGAVKIALGLRISPLVVGLTIVALCTSAPEMAVSFSAALQGDPSVADVALGNVVGSNICNILLILGVCALIRPLKTSESIVKRDFPFCLAISIVTLLVALSCSDESRRFFLPQWYGFALIITFIAYEFIVIKRARREENAQYAASVAETNIPGAGKIDAQTAPEPLSAPTLSNWLLASLQILIGLALLVVGARAFVDGSVSIARSLGVSELVIGLTLVAIGTSLPELTVSAIATFRNSPDVAMGNVVGSNISNLLFILGVTLAALPKGLAVQPQSAFVDIPVMIAAVAIASWFSLSERVLSRGEGAILLLGQFGYAAYLIL
ncbi:MAG: calcium/sodium antiporter [Thermoguttaceae bacterium]|jgi:cation:H+ antiporter